jgi:putative addiction module component (TIGR02574 family)
MQHDDRQGEPIPGEQAIPGELRVFGSAAIELASIKLDPDEYHDAELVEIIRRWKLIADDPALLLTVEFRATPIEVSAEWIAEINRRVAEIEADPSICIPLEDVEAELDRLLGPAGDHEAISCAP